MSNEKKAHWEGIYETKGDNNLSWFQQTAEPSIGLIQRHAPSKSTLIVDVGAGTSRLVDQLLQEGFANVTLVDISRSALDRTAKRLGKQGEGVKFIQTDVTQWKPNFVAGIWHDRAVFHFLTEKPEREAYLAALHSGTAMGSVVVIGTFALDAPEKCSGLFVQRYSEQELKETLGDHFDLLESLRHVHITPAGLEQPFSFVAFRRR